MTDASLTWQALVQKLGLQPHPEGGYYREVFRSQNTIHINGQPRSAATSIYYLLGKGNYSAWHQLDADETWYFLAGQPLLLHVLTDDGALTTCQLGNVLSDEAAVSQYTVPAGRWFAAELAQDSTFALLACNVAPAFEFSAFKLATASDLTAARKRQGSWVDRLLKKT